VREMTERDSQVAQPTNHSHVFSIQGGSKAGMPLCAYYNTAGVQQAAPPQSQVTCRRGSTRGRGDDVALTRAALLLRPRRAVVRRRECSSGTVPLSWSVQAAPVKHRPS
jgi:hypothetical protein